MITGHVFVVASGFGKRVIPTGAPVQFELGLAGALNVTIDDQSAIVTPDQHPSDASSRIADVVEGPSWAGWWLQTTLYRVPLPAGWVAHASGSIEPSAFDLLGPGESLIFIQTPRHVPTIDQMVAPGQTILERSFIPRAELITLGYFDQEHDYRQHHAIVALGSLTAVVTLQGIAQCLPLVSATHRFLIDSIQQGDQWDE